MREREISRFGRDGGDRGGRRLGRIWELVTEGSE